MTSNEVEIERNDVELKHLGFVRVIALNTLVYASHLYEYAKQNSGSLKGAVGTVESAVTTVVGPVYEKFKGVPDVVLSFVDQKCKVFQTLIELDVENGKCLEFGSFAHSVIDVFVLLTLSQVANISRQREY